MRIVRFLAMFLPGFAALTGSAQAQGTLPASFFSPPSESRPSIWWYWGESVTTEHGITRDLESLARVGFGGVVVYEQLFTDRPGALKSLSPEWLDRIRFAAGECARLGLKLEINVGNGFVAGGPWITPELGMQRLVASETLVEGAPEGGITLPRPTIRLETYRDVAVLAYPAPAGSQPSDRQQPRISASPTEVDGAALFAAPPARKVRLAPPARGGPILVRLDYERPYTARSLSFSVRVNSKAPVIATQVPTSWADDFLGQSMRVNPPVGALEASEDGETWKTLRVLPATGSQHDSWDVQTLAFPAFTAKHFRIRLEGWGRNTTYKDDDLVIGNFELRGEARIDQWEEKAGNVVDFASADQTPAYSGKELIDPDTILDLTDRLGPDGRLDWSPPPGSWIVLRLGHTPTGGRTKHGRPEAMGLECDKLSSAAVEVQFRNYVGRILEEVRKVPGARLAGVNVDSNEHGSQNWTARFPEEFHRRRGYELRRLLPAMVGRVVGDAARSDRFLYDVRRTIADLMSDEYFGALRALCHAEGMTLMAQAPGIATCLPSDNIQAKGRVDVPMAEFWMSQRDGTIDCKEAASAGHVYGLPVIAAESFTGSRGDAHPGMMKPFADAALAHGINHFVVLAYVHQPWDDRLPGVTQDRFYVPFQRHNTWWEDSRPFWDTLSRSAHLLRQGHAVIDLLYHLGDDTPLKIATNRLRPVPPRGYDYDVCGDEVLLSRASVKDGRIVLPDGMSYSLLVLAGGQRITLPASRKLLSLVSAGATVLGPVKPDASPSLADGDAGSGEVMLIADTLWGPGALTPRGEKQTGAGRMLWGYTPAEALARIGLVPDFSSADGRAADGLVYSHRRTADRDIYFVANRRAEGTRIDLSLRALSTRPERWSPETGAIHALPSRVGDNGATIVPLALEGYESAFIVFPKPGAEAASALPSAPQGGLLVSQLTELARIEGPWRVGFRPGWGAAPQMDFPRLVSWTEHEDGGVRHYSGPAIYEREFDLAALHGNKRVILDLGRVEILASVTLNGRDLGIVWKNPYTLDVTSALRAGRNTLSIRVVNLWSNRIIGDLSLPEPERKTWLTWNPHKAGDPLLPSGLLGPVRLLRVP